MLMQVDYAIFSTPITYAVSEYRQQVDIQQWRTVQTETTDTYVGLAQAYPYSTMDKCGIFINATSSLLANHPGTSKIVLEMNPNVPHPRCTSCNPGNVRKNLTRVICAYNAFLFMRILEFTRMCLYYVQRIHTLLWYMV